MALFFLVHKTNSTNTPVIVNFEDVRRIYPLAAGKGAEIVCADNESLLVTATFDQIVKTLTPIDFTKSKVSESDLDGYDPIL